MAPLCISGRRVERTGNLLTQISKRKTGNACGAGSAGKHRGFREPLKIERNVVACRAQLAEHPRPPADGRLADDHDAIDSGDEIDDGAMTGLDQPIDLGAW